MPIEFRCSHCGKLLRTGDDTVGRQAQCPECGALTEVPGGAVMATPPPAESTPQDEATGAAPSSPFAPGSPTSATFQQPPYGDAYTIAAALRVAGPAMGLIVTAASGLLIQGLGIIVNLISLAADGPRAMQGRNDFEAIFTPQVAIGTGAFSFAMGILVLMGAMRMKRLESYSLAMAAAIIAMVPCISPCCLLGLPFGIWALVVLNDPSVKAAFRS